MRLFNPEEEGRREQFEALVRWSCCCGHGRLVAVSRGRRRHYCSRVEASIETSSFRWIATIVVVDFTDVAVVDIVAKVKAKAAANPLVEIREACQEYGRAVEKLAFKLLELIALSLGVAADRLQAFFKENTGFMRLNHYPPCPSPHLALGLGRHKDSGALTILSQDRVGGLQVRRKSDGEWISVTPNPGALIINVGDIIQVWSNDKYESVEHRVMVNSDRDRLSIPYFLRPAHYVMVEPLEELVNHGINGLRSHL